MLMQSFSSPSAFMGFTGATASPSAIVEGLGQDNGQAQETKETQQAHVSTVL
eukprot:m.28602 g.28602  ORF g.28602 m.28602 type:complete len:52 (+) comp9056_c0_seq1:579-734(+)